MMVRDKQPSVGGSLSLSSQAPPTNPTGPISKLKRTNSVFTQVPQPILELCSAIQKQDIEAIDRVIQSKSQSLSLTTRITERGRTPLHLAVDSKNPAVVEKLLASDIPNGINIRDDKGITPIHVAVRGGSVDMIKLLMANGADPLVQDDTSNGNAPIHLAVKNFNCFLALVEGMDEEKLKEVMNFRDRKDWCLLHLASYHGQPELIKFLIENKDDINKEGNGGWTAVYIATWYRKVEPLRVLAEAKANLNDKCDGNSTPLHVACEKGYVEIAEILLENGADVNLLDESGNNALHLAAQSGYIHIIRLLIQHHASAHAKNQSGYNAAEIALLERQIDTLHVLIQEYGCCLTKPLPFDVDIDLLIDVINKPYSFIQKYKSGNGSPHRILLAFFDHQFNDVLSFPEECIFDAEKYLASSFDCTMQFTSVELTFPRLIKDNHKTVIDLLHRVKSIQSKNRQIDCGNLLTVLQDTLLGTVDEWNDQLVQIESIAEEEDYIRSQTEASLKIQAEYERLSEEKQFFDALKQEDDFMRLTMDILSKKAELIEKVLVILQKHKNLLGQIRNLDTSCRNDLNRFRNDVEKTLLSCQSRLDTLSSFKNLLGIKREEIEELWSHTYDQSPWLKDIIQEFLELYPQGSSVNGVQCIPIMLNWYIEEKAGQMIKEHELVENSMNVLKEHMNAIDIFCRLTDTAFGSVIKALSFNVDTLTGKKHHLQTDIPDTYKILHDRLVLNEKLCQTNIMHLKNDINNARDKKNEAWAIRHLADLSKYEKIEAQLQKNLKEEQTRLESIERYVPQSFDIVRRYLDSTKIDAWLKELSDAGYKIKRLSQTKKRKRSDAESDMDSDGEANETGTQESGSGSQAMGIRKIAMPKSKKSRLMDFVGTAFKAFGFSWVGTEVDGEKSLPAVAEKADSTIGDVDCE